MKFLCPSEANQERLTLERFTKIDDAKFQFQRTLYKGFRVHQNGEKERVYICMFLSKDTDMDISAESRATVKLERFGDRPNRINHISSPLPQFFITRLGHDRKYTFESLQYEGYFLHWDASKDIIGLKEWDVKEDGALSPELKFAMYTYE